MKGQKKKKTGVIYYKIKQAFSLYLFNAAYIKAKQIKIILYIISLFCDNGILDLY